MPTKPETPEEKRRKGRGPSKLSAATVNAELRTMYMTSLNFVGGVRYLNWLAKKHPAVYMQGLSKYMKPQDDEPGTGFLWVVRETRIVGEPVPGVLNSPITQHIERPRLAAVNGDVIDVEPTDAGD